MSRHNNSASSIRLPFFVAMGLGLGILLGTQLGGNPAGKDYATGSSKIRQVLSFIENDYVDEVNTDKLVESAIENMLKELDPHSLYFPPEDQLIVGSQLEENFEGIGVSFNIFRDTINVLEALSGGPSEAVGIQAGDKIIGVEGETVAGVGITTGDVVRKLRGDKGTEVDLSIYRNGKLLEFTVTRDEIPQYSVDASYMINEETGYIKISRFAITTYDEFKVALWGLQEEGMKNLILDLTGNSGGYMDPALEIVDEFVGGEELLLYTKGKESRYNEKHYADREGVFEEGQLVILIDEGSASASEIVAGSVQDYDRGLIVGRRSFGKGLVQRTVGFKDGSALRLTISRYYTPSGRSIQKPYEKGNLDSYYQEAYDRYSNGEVYQSDSLKVNDSLKFKTKNGRIVYGGGGIIPDVFVPLDSAANGSAIRKAFSTGSLNEFCFQYAQANRDRFEKMSFKEYQTKFEISDSLIEAFLKKLKADGHSVSKEEMGESEEIMKNYLKAFIARGIWGNDGFYPIVNDSNEIVRQALKALETSGTMAVLEAKRE